jgi:hypothetical protein
MKKSKCKCWSCKLSPKIRRFEKSISESQKKSFRKIFNEVWDREEASSMDLNVLEAKIEGSWPSEYSSDDTNSKDTFYHSIGNKIYEIKATLMATEHPL